MVCLGELEVDWLEIDGTAPWAGHSFFRTRQIDKC